MNVGGIPVYSFVSQVNPVDVGGIPVWDTKLYTGIPPTFTGFT